MKFKTAYAPSDGDVGGARERVQTIPPINWYTYELIDPEKYLFEFACPRETASPPPQTDRMKIKRYANELSFSGVKKSARRSHMQSSELRLLHAEAHRERKKCYRDPFICFPMR